MYGNKAWYRSDSGRFSGRIAHVAHSASRRVSHFTWVLAHWGHLIHRDTIAHVAASMRQLKAPTPAWMTLKLKDALHWVLCRINYEAS